MGRNAIASPCWITANRIAEEGTPADVQKNEPLEAYLSTGH
jgi:hypothetical protein